MKLKKRSGLVIILLVIVYLLAIACLSDHGVLSPNGIATRQANATATYGAEVFHIQLTAQAAQP